MKRIILGGIPCTSVAWARLFPEEENVTQKIVPFYEIFSKYYDNRNFFDLVGAVKSLIEEYQPDEIILHDISVTLGLLALIKIKKSTEHLSSSPRIIIFNGAFRGFNIFKASHPLKIQFITFKTFEKAASAVGGEVDERYSLVFSDLKHLYRQIAIASIVSLIKQLSRKKLSKQIDLGYSILILASRNDPYIPFECMKLINADFSHCKFETIDYGHFPYAGDINLIRKKIKEFSSVPYENVRGLPKNEKTHNRSGKGADTDFLKK